jgi:hydroxymethylglutaryl-CoA lyase
MNAAEQDVNHCHLVECPRDAMQGWTRFIPTEQKIRYINALLQVGFHTIDFGSFVSPKAIPQMSDTKEVVTKLDFGKQSDKTTRDSSKCPWCRRSLPV